jgi:hypothetical protein
MQLHAHSVAKRNRPSASATMAFDDRLMHIHPDSPINSSVWEPATFEASFDALTPNSMRTSRRTPWWPVAPHRCSEPLARAGRASPADSWPAERRSLTGGAGVDPAGARPEDGWSGCSRSRQDTRPEGLDADNMANARGFNKDHDSPLTRDPPLESICSDIFLRQPVDAAIRLVALDELDDPTSDLHPVLRIVHVDAGERHPRVAAQILFFHAANGLY